MIVPAQIPNSHVKPRWQAPVGVMESVAAYNCRKYGMPRPILAVPMWEGAGDRAIDFSGHGRSLNEITECAWENNKLKLTDQEMVVGGGEYGALSCVGKDMTIAWSCIVDDITTDHVGVGSQWGGATAYREWAMIYLQTSGTLRFQIDDGASRTVDATTAMSINTIDERVVVFHRGSSVDFYKDGVADGTPAFAYTPTLTTPRRGFVGAWSNDIAETRDTVYEFRGYFDYVYLWDVALTAQQVKFMHDNPYFMFRLPEELYGYSPVAVGHPTMRRWGGIPGMQYTGRRSW